MWRRQLCQCHELVQLISKITRIGPHNVFFPQVMFSECRVKDYEHITVYLWTLIRPRLGFCNSLWSNIHWRKVCPQGNVRSDKRARCFLVYRVNTWLGHLPPKRYRAMAMLNSYRFRVTDFWYMARNISPKETCLRSTVKALLTRESGGGTYPWLYLVWTTWSEADALRWHR